VTSQKPVRTLIADDSGPFSKVVKRWIDARPELTWIGTVASGPDAIAAVEGLSPDLVLIDAVLPGMDGFRVVREVTGMPRSPKTVIMTFEATETVRQAAFAAGADAFIPKDEFAEGLDLLIAELLEVLNNRRGVVGE
jgi:CheY-like chemotaxis protein